MKKNISWIVILTLMIGLLAGCGTQSAQMEMTAPASETTPSPANDTPTENSEPKLTDGIYWIGGNDGTGMPFSWIHFYEDGTYYEKCFDGTALEAGVWELVNEHTEYYVDSDGNKFSDPESESTASSEQTVILSSYAGGSPLRIAYVDDTLVDASLGGGMANHRTLLHDAAYAYDPATDETPIQLFVFYANNDIGANFILNHNRTFEDVTGDFFNEGSWTMLGTGEYELSYADGSKAALKVSDNGKDAVLTLADGIEIVLRDDYKEKSNAVALLMSLRAEEIEVPELPMKVAARIDGYSDGSCLLIIEVAAIGAELMADTGTYEVSAAMKPSFHFEKAGDIEGSPDYASADETGISFSVPYAAVVEPEFNGSATAMTVEAEMIGRYNPNAAATEEAVVVATMRLDDAQVGLPMGVGLRLDCYSDNTAILVVEVAQIGAELEADRGSYEISPAMVFTFRFEKAGEVTGAPDYATATDSSVEINVEYKADVEVEFNGSATPLTIDAVLNGTYSAA